MPCPVAVEVIECWAEYSINERIARAPIFMEIEKSSLTERAIGKAIYGRHYAGDGRQRWGRRDESTLHIF